MPIGQMLQAMRGRCRHCREEAGILQRNHKTCRDTHRAGFRRMVDLVARAATGHSFNEARLRQSLRDIADRSRGTQDDIENALEEGWKQGVAHATADGIITRQEEENLLAFRDRLALREIAADPDSAALLDRAGRDRAIMEARLAALSVQDGDQHLRDLRDSIQEAGLPWEETEEILVHAWETAVEGTLEDWLLSLVLQRQLG